MQKSHDKAEADGVQFFFIHCRDPRDFADIRKRTKNVCTLWVERAGIKPSNEQDKAAAEYKYDFYADLPSLETADYSGLIKKLIESIKEVPNGVKE